MSREEQKQAMDIFSLINYFYFVFVVFVIALAVYISN